MRSLKAMNDWLMVSDVRSARERLGLLGRWYASRPRGTAPFELETLIESDMELGRTARTARIDLLAEVDRRAGPFEPRLLAALLEVPRERFVRPEDIAESAADTPLLLHEEGLATVSAPHAYLLSFRVLGLARGHRLAELGTGSGYGAALASELVGPEGRVLSIEIDEVLSGRACRLLRGYANVRALCGDAGMMVDQWRDHDKVVVAFAVDAVPSPWLDALPEGGSMVVPVGREGGQRLMRVDRQPDGTFAWSDHGAVRYVPNRGRSREASMPGGKA